MSTEIGKTKSKLISAAGKLFAEQGYEQTSIAEISEVAETNIAAVNYHFGNKEHLLIAILDHCQQVAESNYSLWQGKDDLDATPQDKLQFFVTNKLRRIFSDDEASYLYKIKYNMSPSNQNDELFFKRYMESNVVFIENLIGELTGKHFNPVDLRVRAINVISIFKTYATTPRFQAIVQEGYEKSNDELVAHLAPIILSYIAAGIQSYAEA